MILNYPDLQKFRCFCEYATFSQLEDTIEKEKQTGRKVYAQMARDVLDYRIDLRDLMGIK